jgi:hypothetical protein
MRAIKEKDITYLKWYYARYNISETQYKELCKCFRYFKKQL